MYIRDSKRSTIHDINIPGNGPDRREGVAYANPFDSNAMPVIPDMYSKIISGQNIQKELDEGHSYLIVSGDTHTDNILSKMGKVDFKKALILTRTRPGILRDKLGLKPEEGEIFWVSMVANSPEKNILPTEVPGMSMKINEYISKNHKGFIFLGGIEYLILHNGFEPVMKFLQYIIDTVSLSDVKLVVPIDPLAFDTKEWRMLSRDIDTVTLK